MREKVISVAYEIFLTSAKECENEKKTNSYNVFLNFWSELVKSKHLGYHALTQCLKSMSQVEKLIVYDKSQIFDINSSQYRDTLNEWIIGNLTEIKHSKAT